MNNLLKKSTKNKHTFKAIVLGGHFQGLGAIRALGESGVSVVLMDHEPNISKFSRYVSQYIKSPDLSDREKYLQFLLKSCEKYSLQKAVLFPIDDETVHFLSINHAELSKYFNLWTPAWEFIEPLYHKGIGYKLAEKIGIPIPKTAYPQSIEDVAKWDGPFPALIKPAIMRSFFKQTGKKVFPAGNMIELQDAYKKAVQIIPASEILIQEEIPDVSNNLYSFCPLFDGSSTLARIVAKRIRQHPMDFGQASTFAEIVREPELETMGTRYLKSVGYSGLGEVEFIKDPRDGQFKFLEVNPRIWGWHTLAIAAGVNLPYLTYLWCIGEKITPSDYHNARWIRLLTDLAVGLSESLKGRWTLWEYMRTLKGAKTYAVWSLKDPLPFFVELFLLPFLIFKRGF